MVGTTLPIAPRTDWCDEHHALWRRSSREIAPTALVARIASAQRGLVTTPQLRAAGLSRQVILAWARSGRLHRVHRGVYRVGHEAPVEFSRELAALLAVGPDAALSHESGLLVAGILEASPGAVHVSVAGRDARSRPGILVHRASLPRGAVERRNGMRVTSPLRTLLDLAGAWPERRYAWAVNEAQAIGLVTAADLRRAAASGAHRRGIAALRRQIEGPGFTIREAEARLLRLLLRSGLRPTGTNVEIAGWGIDVWFEPARLVVEVDSFAFHGTRAAFERDRAKDAELAAAGLVVIRPTWLQITREPRALVARIRRTVDVRSSGPTRPM